MAGMKINNSIALDAALRKDLASFIARVFPEVDGSQQYQPGWYVDVMADYLAGVVRGDDRRLIITLPPRHLKSICTSVALVAWILGHDPKARIICVTHSEDLARKLARDCRKVMNSRWYRRLFPGTRLLRHRSAAHDFETTKGGGRLSVSAGGPITGRGAEYIIIDDPIKPRDAMSETKRTGCNQWYDSTVYTRLNNKKTGRIILIMQRLHQDDLVGHVIEKENWRHLCLPAIAEKDERFDLLDGRVVGRNTGEALHPEREPLEILKQAEINLGSFYFQAQYQQAPVPECGNLVKWAWFNMYEELPPARNHGDQFVQSWDTAVSANDNADWSVCTTWAIRGKSYYLVDVFRARLEFPFLKRKIVELKNQFNVRDVLIEEAGAAIGLIQLLRDEDRLRPIAIKPQGSKEDRMAAQSAVIEAGNVHVQSTASWLDTFRLELVAFPGGKNDDQVDSLSQFLNWVGGRRGGMKLLRVRA
jgi:predicted phage terminase large subunit-like protein